MMPLAPSRWCVASPFQTANVTGTTTVATGGFARTMGCTDDIYEVDSDFAGDGDDGGDEGNGRANKRKRRTG